MSTQRDALMRALAAAEAIVSGAPVVPESVDASRYLTGLSRGEYGLSAHYRTATAVRRVAEWAGAEVAMTPQPDGWWKTGATFRVQGVLVSAWALHTLAAAAVTA